MSEDPACSLKHLLHLISHQLLISPTHSPICPSSISAVASTFIASAVPSLPPVPHYPPPHHKAVRVLGIRWAVKSHKLLLLCVWPGNRGGRDRERKRERDFMLQHFWTWIAPLPRCPFLPLFTQTWTSTRTAARLLPTTTQIPPPAHIRTHTTSSPPTITTSSEHVTAHHPHGKDTSTTLLQRAGHFTEQLDESLQSSRGIKPLLNLRRAISATSTRRSNEQLTTHRVLPTPPGTPPDIWQNLAKGHKHTCCKCFVSVLLFYGS